MISKYSQCDSIERLGVYKRFPNIRSYLNKMEAENDPDPDRESLKKLVRYVAEGKYGYSSEFVDMPLTFGAYNACQELISISNTHQSQAIQNALGLHEGWPEEWRKAMAYRYWSEKISLLITASNYKEHKSDQTSHYSGYDSLRRLGILLGQLTSLSWFEQATELAGAMLRNLDIQGFYDAGDYSHRRTQHFVLRLVGSWQGWPERNEPACAYDEPLFNALIEHWRTTDLELIQHLLLVACDRHTHQARPDTSTRHYDLSWPDAEYDPFEILSVLRLRETLGLPNPELDHPLMNTPLGKLPEPSEPYMDELLEGVLARACDELPELCAGTGITPKTTEPEKPTSLFSKLFGKK